MLQKQEISRVVESLIRKRSYWVKNDSLNFIDRIRRERSLTKKQSDSLNRIKKSIENIHLDCWQVHLNFDSIYQIKNLVLEIRMLF